MDPSLHVRFCEYATVHPDGTFTLVRGGIDVWTAAAMPATAALSLFVEIPSGTLPPGRYPLSFTLTTASGKKVLEALAEMSIADPRKAVPIAVSVSAELDTPGNALLVVRCGPVSGMAVLDVRLREEGE